MRALVVGSILIVVVTVSHHGFNDDCRVAFFQVAKLSMVVGLATWPSKPQYQNTKIHTNEWNKFNVSTEQLQLSALSLHELTVANLMTGPSYGLKLQCLH